MTECKLNRRVGKQLNRMVKLGTTDPSDIRNALLSRALILASLPYRRIADSKLDVQIPLGNGVFLLVRFSAGFSGVPLPFGDDALLLDLLASEARRSGVPEITFESASDLIRFLQTSKGGDTAKQVLERLKRLRGLTLGISWRGDNGEVSRLYRIFEECWLPNEHDAKREEIGERALIPFYLRLSPEFMRELRNHYRAIPRDVLLTFRGSPTEYSTAKWIVDRVETTRSSSVVPWEDLARERGSQDSNLRRFRDHVRTVLKKLKAGMPEIEAAIHPTPKGLRIGPKALVVENPD